MGQVSTYAKKSTSAGSTVTQSSFRTVGIDLATWNTNEIKGENPKPEYYTLKLYITILQYSAISIKFDWQNSNE